MKLHFGQKVFEQIFAIQFCTNFHTKHDTNIYVSDKFGLNSLVFIALKGLENQYLTYA
jgi:hypothetical protein